MTRRKPIAILLSFALAVVLHSAAAPGPARAQTAPSSEESVAAELMGSPVFTADGSEVGQVSAVTVDGAGAVTGLRMTTASPLGFGLRVVILPSGSFTAVRGAVVLDLSPSEVDALPSVSGGSPSRNRSPA